MYKKGLCDKNKSKYILIYYEHLLMLRWKKIPKFLPFIFSIKTICLSVEPESQTEKFLKIVNGKIFK